MDEDDLPEVNGRTFNERHPDLFEDELGVKYVPVKDDPRTSLEEGRVLFDYKLPESTEEPGEADFNRGEKRVLKRKYKTQVQVWLDGIKWERTPWEIAMHELAVQATGLERRENPDAYMMGWESLAERALVPESAQSAEVTFEVESHVRVDPITWGVVKRSKFTVSPSEAGRSKTLSSKVCGRVLMRMHQPTWLEQLEVFTIDDYMRVPRIAEVLDREQQVRERGYARAAATASGTRRPSSSSSRPHT